MGRVYAGLSLGLDFAYIAGYVITLGLGCGFISAHLFHRRKVFQTTGIILSWALIFAGLCDCIENIALIQVLVGSTQPFWLLIAFFVAWVKFIIVGNGILYNIIGLFILIVKEIRRTGK